MGGKSAVRIDPAGTIEGTICMPGDKSISHRAVMLGSISAGKTRIENFLDADDCRATLGAFSNMGVSFRPDGDVMEIDGAGLKGLRKPDSELYLGNSGTTMRLILGILAGQEFECTLTGDSSLSKRPMKRVTAPLREMGAAITGRDDADYAPLTIKGARLKPIDYISPIASAQVKSAILLAGLYADGATRVTEPYKSRDHTERMLSLFGADVNVSGLTVTIKSGGPLKGRRLSVPGDISSAAFFIVAALLLDGSRLTIKNVGFNDTRTGLVAILKRMGGRIEAVNLRDGWEPVCDLVVSSSRLTSTDVAESEIPAAIDELPILMVAAAFAEGRTVIRGAHELRVKETDRIHSMFYNLRAMGADISADRDDVLINGVKDLRGSADLKSFADHRTAMAAAVAAMCSRRGRSVIDDGASISTSFPQFFALFDSVLKR